eukprot:TRINITY_DN13263_c0_g1_i1.p1 TRINITY_DN13263_c0_g1~~TRINITY_DN13263_c0_g1_i1.p1  ORF type:complete len:306 (-),score=98.31 TRINITY_DN13263_c0_g1_i1:58-924(-)
MNDKDRTSIHEAMEQQTISISKAGIVASLQARCAVIAAANPLKGKYDSAISFAHNVDLTEPILSRFDVLCVVRDQVDIVQDERLAQFVVQSHIRSHPMSADDAQMDKRQPEISQTMLKKYIMYAKQNCKPKLLNLERAREKICRLYADLRRASTIGGGMPMTVRHVESIIRMSEAHAKIHLRSDVIEEDLNVAIRVMLDSFISSQKFSVAQSLKNSFRKFVTYKKDNLELLFHLLQRVVKRVVILKQSQKRIDETTQTIEIDCDVFESAARGMDITDFSTFYASHMFA